MTALLLAWVAFPLVLGGVSLGCGLLVQRAAGRRLPGVLLVPAGFALVVVSASLATTNATTAQLTTPVVVALAVGGLGLSLAERRRVDPWAVAAALGVFAVFAAPIVLTGQATWAGYLTLDDTSTWLGLADNALQHGRSWSSLAPSTYSVVVQDYMSTGYPLGAFLPLGIGHQLTAQDSAWLFQPQIAFMAAMLGLAVYGLASSLLHARPLRALVAFLGCQSALLFGYAFWSGIKEVTTAALVGVLAALVASSQPRAWRPRDVLPVAVVAAAILDVVAITGLVWLAAIGLLAVALVAVCGLRRGGLLAGALAGATLLLGLPALLIARTFVRVADNGGSGSITSTAELGNLLRPLSTLQLFGIWPVGDFRLRPADIQVTYVLIAALAVAAIGGVVVSLRRRAFAIPLYLLTALAGCLAVLAAKQIGHSSPWLVGKALATASPALTVAGIFGAAVLFEGGRRLEGGVAAAAIASGVLWSNGLAYGSFWIAPRGQFAELQSIGRTYAGDGPTLLTEYSPYATKHFLRNLDPEGAAQRRYREVRLRTGGMLERLQYADLDAFQLSAVTVYRTIVLRTSALESRPPSTYRLVHAGRWYEVWQRPVAPATILEHLSLGTEQQPVGVASCSEVRRLGRLAAANGGRVVAALRAPASVYDLTAARFPASWQTWAGGILTPSGPGTVTLDVTAATAGSYGFWLGGSFRDHLVLSVDGRRVGGATGQLNEIGQLTSLGSIELATGRHRVELRYGGPGLRPGSRGAQFGFGPLAVGRPAADAKLLEVRPAEAASLCGRSFDWLEAVAG